VTIADRDARETSTAGGASPDGTLQILVLSDIHAFGARSNPASEPSWTKANVTTLGPFSALERLLAEAEAPNADIILCPGDICDQADEQGLSYAWNRLTSLASQLGAQLVATAGNHDLDSRFLTSRFNPKGTLQRLAPPFPHASHGASDQYWARNYAAIVDGSTLVVTLNSAAFHGYHNDDQMMAEFNHGRVSEETVSDLYATLDGMDLRGIEHRLLLCHHHPQMIGPFPDVEGDSAMKDAHLLLNRLSGDAAPWLIVHGHRHYPDLSYAQGGANSPVIFSAGSFSRRLGDIYEGKVANQFYEITLLGSGAREAVGLDIAGTFRTWTWGHSEGWIPAPERTGLPRRGGFGARGGLASIRAAIRAELQRYGPSGTSWEAIAAAVPAVRYLLPTDLAALLQALSAQSIAMDPLAGDLPTGSSPSSLAVAP
jgi:3',5'-cyclic AMP phosphodiesterase CpdA